VIVRRSHPQKAYGPRPAPTAEYWVIRTLSGKPAVRNVQRTDTRPRLAGPFETSIKALDALDRLTVMAS
jgi:hypothetical protein